MITGNTRSEKMPPKIKNALSIDVEDWYQGLLQMPNSDWPKQQDRLSANITKILDILATCQVKATFFVLGCVADKHPEIIGQIVKGGHELASHGFGHQLVYRQSPAQFRDDVKRSKELIENAANVKIRGYRAPFFSITKDCLWAFDILNDLGFSYDSSVFPAKNFLYGMPDAPSTPYKIDKTDMLEFPLSVLKIANLRLPVCGGFYLRTLPYPVTKFGINRFNNKGRPAIIYMHPWEVDPGKPSIPMSLKWKLIHEFNIAAMENKFRRLLKDFSFTTISEVLFGR